MLIAAFLILILLFGPFLFPWAGPCVGRACALFCSIPVAAAGPTPAHLLHHHASAVGWMRRLYAVRSGDLRVVLDCGKNPSAPPGLPPLAVVAPHARLLRHRQRVLEPTLPPSLTAVLLRHVLNETTPSSPSSWCVLQAHLAILLHLLPAPDVRGRGLTMRAPLQHRRLRLSHVMFRPTFTAFLVSRLGELRLQFHKRQLQIRLPPSFLLLWLFRDWWLPASTMESPARGCICHHHHRRCQLAFSFCRSAQLSVSTAFASC